MIKMRRLVFRVYPLLRAAISAINADAGIIFENMMREETFHRSWTVLFQDGDAEAIQARLQIETLIHRNTSAFLERRCKRFGIPVLHVAKVAEEVHDQIGVGNRYRQRRGIESTPSLEAEVENLPAR